MRGFTWSRAAADRIFLSVALFLEAADFIGQLAAELRDFLVGSDGGRLGHLALKEEFFRGDIGFAFGFDLGDALLLFVTEENPGVFGREAFHGEFVSGFHEPAG